MVVKIEILAKNWHFGQKSKLFRKIFFRKNSLEVDLEQKYLARIVPRRKILAEHCNYDPKIEILAKNRNTIKK